MSDSRNDLTVPAGKARFIAPDTAGWPVHWQRPTAGDLECLEARYRRGFPAAHAPLLGQGMPPLRVGSADCYEVTKRLVEAVCGEIEAGGRGVVGLAAPQIGIAARAFVYDPRETATPELAVEELRCVVNGTVEVLDGSLRRDVEGCLSTGRVRGWVFRAERVRLLGFTPGGDLVDVVHTGHAARVIQHETDHLDGILFPERVEGDSELLWASVEQDERFVEYVRAERRGERPRWNTLTPRDQWDAIRDGLSVFGRLETR